jgi:hypothetical protein
MRPEGIEHIIEISCGLNVWEDAVQPMAKLASRMIIRAVSATGGTSSITLWTHGYKWDLGKIMQLCCGKLWLHRVAERATTHGIRHSLQDSSCGQKADPSGYLKISP